MSKISRIQLENAIYHITAYGNNKKDIFLSRKDYSRFLILLGKIQKRHHITIYCYCLMKNHYHLIIKTPKANLSRIMKYLNSQYTIYFNKTHNINEHLFNRSFCSVVIDKGYLVNLSRYIHLNPVRKKLAQEPEDYHYSSMRYYLGDLTKPFDIETSFVLNRLGNSFDDQIQRYKELVDIGKYSFNNFYKNIFSKPILGDSNFIKKTTLKYLQNKYIEQKQKDCYLDNIIKSMLDYYTISKKSLSEKKYKPSNAKKIFIYLARKHTDHNLKDLCLFFNNNLSESAISAIFTRTIEELKQNRGLKRVAQEIEKKFLQLTG